MSKSLASPKGMKKGFSGATEKLNSARVIALVPVPLGPGAMGAPMPGEEPRSLERANGTCRRLKETISMMKKGRV